MSTIVDNANDSEDTKEVISSEELCGLIDDMNARMIREGVDMDKVMMSSLDTVALYPSLEIRRSAEIVSERVISSGVRFEGEDYKWAVKYLALAMSRKEIVQKGLVNLVLKREETRGAQIGPSSQ